MKYTLAFITVLAITGMAAAQCDPADQPDTCGEGFPIHIHNYLEQVIDGEIVQFYPVWDDEQGVVVHTPASPGLMRQCVDLTIMHNKCSCSNGEWSENEWTLTGTMTFLSGLSHGHQIAFTGQIGDSFTVCSHWRNVTCWDLHDETIYGTAFVVSEMDMQVHAPGVGFGFTDQFGHTVRTPDLNCDGKVDVLDLLILLGAWGAATGNMLPDLNADGVVDVFDLFILLENWG